MIYDIPITLCELTGSAPLDLRLTNPRARYCGERTVGISRFFVALQAGNRIDRVVELWRTDVAPDQIAVMPDGGQYRIVQVQQAMSEDGLPITVLSLSQLEQFYGFVTA